MRNLGLIALLSGALIGCNGSTTGTDDEPGDDVTTDDSDSDGDTDPDQVDDGVSPIVESGEVTCIESATGDVVFTWAITVQASDPQGNETLGRWNEVGIYGVENGVELYKDEVMVCDDEGACVASVREQDSGVLCSQAANYAFRVRLFDEDENVSQPFTLTYVP